MRIYYPVLAAFGVPVNLVAIVILSRGKCGLSKCISRYLVGMAVADLLVVITDPILNRINTMFLPRSFLDITPVCSFIYFCSFSVTVLSVWFTVAFTFDRFVAICCEKLKTKYCTERTAAVVLGTVSVLGCLESVPTYFIYEPRFVTDNVPWFCVGKPSFRTSPAWAAFDMFNLILTPFIPFCLILLLNVLTVRRILVSSRVRRGLRSRSNGENQSDPEMENRKKSIILLFSISGSFILLWLTKVVFYIYLRISDLRSYYSYTDPNYITHRTSTMLQLLSSCINTCIYVLTQTKFREELKNAVKYPFNLIVIACEADDLATRTSHAKLQHDPSKCPESSRKWDIGLRDSCTKDLSSALSTKRSLTDLNLGINELGDSGVKLLFAALKNPNCKIQKLQLRENQFSSNGRRHLESLRESRPGRTRQLLASPQALSFESWKDTAQKQAIRAIAPVPCPTNHVPDSPEFQGVERK
ncbi:probable G-protein coupled receptor 139 [Heptranchias perlo]|uniref:probable G-protein coupled receptor 139 n=1 Tax=Heptranchias perlo TaxID=212740 RepID=UPI003559CC41